MNKIIFTDCFNTIILRKVSDKVVTYNFCEKLGEKYDIEPVVLYNLITKFKYKLAIKNFFKTGESEIKLENVISEVAQILKKNIDILDIDAFKKDALSIYIEAEMASHYLNESFILKLKKFKTEGAKIYVLSDFYCGKKVLALWFKNLGISDLFDEIFVSCDYMSTKRSTRLYKKVIRKLGIRKKQITMFGDNRYADVFCARLTGIKSFRVQTKIEKAPKEFKYIKQFGSQYKKFNEIFERYGDHYNYSNHAFPLFLFIRRLYNELEKRKVKNVFFLAREGLFLKKLFDKYAEKRNGIKSFYLEVSRNALYRVLLKPLEEQDFSYFFNKMNRLSTYQFLCSLSFSEQEIANVQAEINENIKKKKHNFEKTKTFRKLINCESFKKIYEIKRKEQEGVFNKYLESFGIDFEKEGLDVVDVGWRGSMQDLLANYLTKKIKIRGWYIGYLKAVFSKNYKDFNHKSKKGLLYDMRKNTQLGNQCFKPILLDYEQICRADRGCVYGYEIVDNKPTILYEKKIDEKAIHTKFILPLQTQIENKFADLCELEYKNLSIIEPLAIIRHMDIYRNISRYDTNFYVNAINSHFDNFISVGIPKGSSAIKRLLFDAVTFLLRLRFKFYRRSWILKSFYKRIIRAK